MYIVNCIAIARQQETIIFFCKCVCVCICFFSNQLHVMKPMSHRFDNEYIAFKNDSNELANLLWLSKYIGNLHTVYYIKYKMIHCVYHCDVWKICLEPIFLLW